MGRRNYNISFNKDDCTTIVDAVQRGTYPYEVGDTKIIDLGDLGKHTIRVSNTTPCKGLDLSSQSACGFVLEFADIITTHDMNTLSTNFGSWPASAMRTYVNNTIYNAMPNELRNAVIDTYVVSGHGDGDSSGVLANNNFGSTDKLYLLSPKEVWGSDAGGSDTASGDNITRQLDWYNDNNVTSSSYSKAIKNIGTTPSNWWLRSPDSVIDIDFSMVTTLGGWSAGAAGGATGVSPAFRLAQ